MPANEVKATRAVVEVPLTHIRPSPHQNRIFSDEPDEELRRLAESIQAQGVISPVILRPVNDDDKHTHELVAGERRVRASGLAGESTVPAIVRELDDEEAAQITVLENLEREDLSPMEEAAGVQTLLRVHKDDIDAVADRLGRPRSWVARRARLLNLSGKWRNAAEDPDSVISRWQSVHLEVIARLPVVEQDHVYDANRFYLPAKPTVRRLEELVDGSLRKLSSVPWDPDDEDLLPDRPACSSCPHRTSVCPTLFEELEDGEDRCTEPSCWHRKQEQAVEAAMATASDEVVLVYTNEPGRVRRTNPEFLARAISFGAVTEAPKSKGGRLCMFVSGPRATQTFYAKVPDWLLKRATPDDKDEEASKGPTPLSVRRQKLGRRRWKWIAEQVQQVLLPPATDEVPEPTLDPDRIPDEEVLMRLAFAVGTTLKLEAGDWTQWDTGAQTSLPQEQIEKHAERDNTTTTWARFKLYRYKRYREQFRLDAWKQLVPILTSRVRYFPQLEIETLQAEIRAVCNLIGEDVDAWIAHAREEIPDPKSWADLNEDGTRKRKTKSED